jgi:cold-inducible RNA-binding protein
MNRKLYVGNLPYAYTSDELREMFEPHGPVQSATVIIDRKSGRSRGFGFVEYESEESAKTAIETLNGTSLGGRDIVVSEARERPQGDGRGAGRDRDPAQQD